MSALPGGHSFTIVDGVPKKLLGESLKRVGSDTITQARKDLEHIANGFSASIKHPNGNPSEFPVPDDLEASLEQLRGAIATYRQRFDVGQHAWQQGCELLRDDETETAP